MKTVLLAIAVLAILVLSCTSPSTAVSQSNTTVAPTKSLFAAKHR